MADPIGNLAELATELRSIAVEVRCLLDPLPLGELSARIDRAAETVEGWLAARTVTGKADG